jgi:hypothetical protein
MVSSDSLVEETEPVIANVLNEPAFKLIAVAPSADKLLIVRELPDKAAVVPPIVAVTVSASSASTSP